MNSVAAVVLAGGLGRRMGGADKPLLTVRGRPILSHVIERLGPQTAGLVLNANGDPARFAGFGLPVAADSVEGFAGPLAGVLAGMDFAAAAWPAVEHVVSAPGDTPFIPADLVARLDAARAAAGVDIAVAESAGRTHHAVALWPLALREDLRRALLVDGVRAVSAYIARHSSVAASWSVEDGDPFFNVNRPEDLREAGDETPGGALARSNAAGGLA